MDNNKNTTTVKSGGIGFTGLLAIAFIVLKLIGVIEWSWLWVFSPLWITFAIVFVLLIIYLIIS